MPKVRRKPPISRSLYEGLLCSTFIITLFIPAAPSVISRAAARASDLAEVCRVFHAGRSMSC